MENENYEQTVAQLDPQLQALSHTMSQLCELTQQLGMPTFLVIDTGEKWIGHTHAGGRFAGTYMVLLKMILEDEEPLLVRSKETFLRAARESEQRLIPWRTSEADQHKVQQALEDLMAQAERLQVPVMAGIEVERHGFGRDAHPVIWFKRGGEQDDTMTLGDEFQCVLQQSTEEAVERIRQRELRSMAAKMASEMGLSSEQVAVVELDGDTDTNTNEQARIH